MNYPSLTMSVLVAAGLACSPEKDATFNGEYEQRQKQAKRASVKNTGDANDESVETESTSTTTPPVEGTTATEPSSSADNTTTSVANTSTTQATRVAAFHLCDQWNKDVVPAPLNAKIASMNPADRQYAIRLSSGNRQVETTTTTNGQPSVNDSVRADIGHNSGKWFIEYCVKNVTTSPFMFLGTSTPQLSLENTPGGSDFGCAIARSGFIDCDNGGNTVNNANSTIVNGAVISIAIDLTANKMWFALNQKWLTGGAPNVGPGIAFLRPSDSNVKFFPTVNLSSGDVIAINFGHEGFSMSVPVGFNAGWYE